MHKFESVCACAYSPYKIRAIDSRVAPFCASEISNMSIINNFNKFTFISFGRVSVFLLLQQQQQHSFIPFNAKITTKANFAISTIGNLLFQAIYRSTWIVLDQSFNLHKFVWLLCALRIVKFTFPTNYSYNVNNIKSTSYRNLLSAMANKIWYWLLLFIEKWKKTTPTTLIVCDEIHWIRWICHTVTVSLSLSLPKLAVTHKHTHAHQWMVKEREK